MTLASTLSRPRWAMPITASSRSASAASLITTSSSGISASPPSSEKRFWPTYLVCRNVSNASATLSLDRMRTCSWWPAPAGRELALQLPQRQAVLDDVQVRVLALHGLDRFGVGHQVAAYPVGVDEL